MEYKVFQNNNIVTSSNDKEEVLRYVYYNILKYGHDVRDYTIREFTKFKDGTTTSVTLNLTLEMNVYYLIQVTNKSNNTGYWCYDKDKKEGYTVEFKDDAMRYFSRDAAERVSHNLMNGSSTKATKILRYSLDGKDVVTTCRDCSNFIEGNGCLLHSERYKYLAHVLCDDFMPMFEAEFQFSNGSRIKGVNSHTVNVGTRGRSGIDTKPMDINDIFSALQDDAPRKGGLGHTITTLPKDNDADVEDNSDDYYEYDDD